MDNEQREVIQFFGRPSDGTFKTVAVVQDAVVIEPTAESRNALAAIFPKDNEYEPICPPDALNAAIDRALKAKDVTAQEFIRKRDSFPVTGSPTPDGRYGMHRTVEGHALSVRRCLRALRPIVNTFDALYVTGLSGTIPAAVVAYMLKKELLVLRKQDSSGDTNSHGMLLEGDVQYQYGRRYIILDDFVSNGGTLRSLLKHFPARQHGKLVGVMLYGHGRTRCEDQGDPAKILHTYPNGEHRDPVRVHMIRRSRHSMLFDLIPTTEEPR